MKTKFELWETQDGTRYTLKFNEVAKDTFEWDGCYESHNEDLDNFLASYVTAEAGNDYVPSFFSETGERLY